MGIPPADDLPRPRASVVIPTYNRQDLLSLTLRSLAAQRAHRDTFEVVVSDDGSTDGTAEVARSFQDRLRLRYRYQDDLGFRAATARNEGARLAAAPVLIFLDTGVVAGPDLVGGHLRAHGPTPGGRAVLGYTYGYRPRPLPELDAALRAHSPEQVVERFAGDPDFRDWRHDVFEQVDYDLTRRALPWQLFWTLNVSVAAADFAAVGGFDDGFHGWGAEDLELGYRLFRHGVGTVADRGCWAVDSPHERDIEQNLSSNHRNMLRFLLKHGDPAIELCWAGFTAGRLWPIEGWYLALRDWQEKARGLTVADEIAAGLDEAPAGGRIVVFGCGAAVPAGLPPAVLVDFDPEALAATGGDHRRLHAVGVRTELPDDSADLVLITSRLSGVWETWGERILAEAHRVAPRVWVATGM